jgi:predicted transcriptional regulator
MSELTAAAGDVASNVTRIVEVFLAHNPCTTAELPQLIANVRASLADGHAAEQVARPQVLRPAVPVANSVAPHHVTCLECGKTFKSIRGHLRVAHNLMPAEYRKKWGLRADHPMVAPEYAAIRSQLSKQLALGGRRRAKSKTGAQRAAPVGGTSRPLLSDESRSLVGQPG